MSSGLSLADRLQQRSQQRPAPIPHVLPPSPKPCNQRAPKGLVTLSLGWSTRAGKAATSIIWGSWVMWVKYLGSDPQPPCHSDRQWSVSWAGPSIHATQFLFRPQGLGSHWDINTTVQRWGYWKAHTKGEWVICQLLFCVKSYPSLITTLFPLLISRSYIILLLHEPTFCHALLLNSIRSE